MADALQRFPATAIAVALVWIDMLPGDPEAAAAHTASIVTDPRVSRFHDPGRIAGRAIAGTVGGAGEVAWDSYLFYGPGSRFGDPPRAWFHQLGAETWADPAAFRWGDALTEAIRETVGSLA